MKPIIISVTEDKDGYIKMKREDFEKYIDEAYFSGKQDGTMMQIPYCPPYIQTYRDPIYDTSDFSSHTSLKTEGITLGR